MKIHGGKAAVWDNKCHAEGKLNKTVCGINMSFQFNWARESCFIKVVGCPKCRAKLGLPPLIETVDEAKSFMGNRFILKEAKDEILKLEIEEIELEGKIQSAECNLEDLRKELSRLSEKIYNQQQHYGL